MIQAIVYVSETGHTKHYAELLGEKTGLPVFELSSAVRKLSKGAEIIYLGWLMAGTVKGLKKAQKYFALSAVCGVGMSAGQSQLADMRKNNPLPDTMPLFYLQGGFEMEKLHGVYKLMMKTMRSTVGRQLSDKPDKTPEEDSMLSLLLHGGDLVSADALSGILAWYSRN